MFGQKSVSAWFFDSTVHQEAISRLLYLVENNASLGLVTGPDGSGRSRVLKKLQEELTASCTGSALVNLSGLDSDMGLWQIASALCSGLRIQAGRRELLTRLQDEVVGRSQCGLQTVVLLDDLHKAADDGSILLRYLLSLGSQSLGLMTVIVASGKPIPTEFADQTLVRISLAPLDSAESSDFIRSLVRRVMEKAAVVDESAVRAVADFSMGNTARIAKLVELLRVVHETSPDSRISEETVEAMILELSPDNLRQPQGLSAVMRAS